MAPSQHTTNSTGTIAARRQPSARSRNSGNPTVASARNSNIVGLVAAASPPATPPAINVHHFPSNVNLTSMKTLSATRRKNRFSLSSVTV
jgi:hypothetical protein